MLYLENGAFTGRLLGSRYFWLVYIVFRHHTLREACTAEYSLGRNHVTQRTVKNPEKLFGEHIS